MSVLTNQWLPIPFEPWTAAVKGLECDLVAKNWIAKDDRFIHRRFVDCHWDSEKKQWRGVDAGWRPTHFMLVALPEVE